MSIQKITAFEVRSASVTGKVTTGVILIMPLQMLVPGELSAATIVSTGKSFLCRGRSRLRHD
jgi:hypothetical protein